MPNLTSATRSSEWHHALRVQTVLSDIRNCDGQSLSGLTVQLRLYLTFYLIYLHFPKKWGQLFK